MALKTENGNVCRHLAEGTPGSEAPGEAERGVGIEMVTQTG